MVVSTDMHWSVKGAFPAVQAQMLPDLVSLLQFVKAPPRAPPNQSVACLQSGREKPFPRSTSAAARLRGMVAVVASVDMRPSVSGSGPGV